MKTETVKVGIHEQVQDEILYFCPADLVKKTFFPNQQNRVFDPENNAKVNQIANDMNADGFSKHHPLIVHSSGMIFSGHHRYHAALKANIGVYYKIDDNYDFFKENHRDGINKNWSTQDWIATYSNEGNETYQAIRQFVADHPYLGIKLVHSILSDKANHQPGNKIETFCSGNFIPAITFEEANKVAIRLKQISDMLTDDNKPKTVKQSIPLHFGFACLAMFKAEGYDHNKFLEKFNKQKATFTVQINRRGNIAALEKAYNWGQRENFISIKNIG